MLECQRIGSSISLGTEHDNQLRNSAFRSLGDYGIVQYAHKFRSVLMRQSMGSHFPEDVQYCNFSASDQQSVWGKITSLVANEDQMKGRPTSPQSNKLSH